MSTQPLETLPPGLAAFMQEPRVTLLTTIDAGGSPLVNALSWVWARDGETLRLVGDARTQFIRNIKADARVVLTVQGAGSIWSIYGTARILADELPGLPLIPTLVQVEGLRVHEAIWLGARLTQEPLWAASCDPDLASGLDRQVFALMRDFAE